jgi:hypothetical protein
MRGPWPLAKANGLANGFALKKGLLITNAAMCYVLKADC